VQVLLDPLKERFGRAEALAISLPPNRINFAFSEASKRFLMAFNFFHN